VTVSASRPIAFLTDFGEDDFYAGVLRAVAASIAPASARIDISHEVRAHDVHLASFVLALSFDYLPRDTVVVAVVDPGVGGARRAVVAEFGTRCVVAPDNGLLSDLLVLAPDARIVAIDDDAANRVTGVSPRGATFHGRDVFAPVAASIATGVSASEFGGDAGGVVMLHDVPSLDILSAADPASACIRGTGRMIDRFGNILTDIPRAAVQHVFGARDCRVRVNGVDAGPLRRTYSDGAPGELIAIVNSWERVEAAVREGRAAERFAGLDATGIRFELRGA